MPYKKKYKSKSKTKRPSNGKAWYNRKYSAMDIANKAWSAAKWIKGVLNTESDFYDSSGTMSADDNGSAVIPLSAIPQGDGASQRIGRQVKAVSLSGHFNITLNASVNQDVVRIVVVSLRDGTVPGITTIMDSATVNSFYNLNNTRVFEVLCDKSYSIDANYKGLIHVRFHCKLNHKIQWAKDDSTTPQYGNIYMFSMGTTANASGVPTTIDYNLRLRYVDN